MARAKSKKPVAGKKSTTKVKAGTKKPAKKKPVAKKTTKKTSAAKKPLTVKEARARLRARLKKARAKKAKAANASGLVWSTPAELGAAWNAAGRAYHTQLNALLSRLYAGEQVEIDVQDTRTTADGDAVLAQIIAMNAEGRGAEARAMFDPAYGPMFEWIKSTESQLGFVTILGPEELLVYQGQPWEAGGRAYHLRGFTARPLPGVCGFTRSRNGEHLVVAREGEGLEFYDGVQGGAALDAAPVATLPWPPLTIFKARGLSEAQDAAWSSTGERFHLESLQVSDDGMRFVATFYRQGILLGSRHPGDPAWQLLHPDARPPYGRPDRHAGDDIEDTIPRAGDMTHAAISRDGTRVAWGSQDTPHYLAEVNTDGEAIWYATVGNLSEYPHNACFSDNGRYVALNSCHFYNGATVAFDWDAGRGAVLPSYEVSPQAPQIDGTLRVYASCWLPASVVAAVTAEPSSEGAFALAGSGIVRIRTPKAKLLVVQGFGSSASSMAFDSASRRLAIGSYSGMVHLYDPYEEEEPGRIDGIRPRRELARWCFWTGLPNGPIRW